MVLTRALHSTYSWSRVQVFILDADRLRVGDIILTADKTLLSKGIRAATGGSFSHAMLYVADHSYIHSDRDGVHSGNTQRRLFSALGDAAVLRLRNRDASAVERACVYARTQIGKQYSKVEAVRSRTFRDAAEQLEDSNRQFCSRLVAQAYSVAGVPLVPNADYCYPSDFATSQLLQAVAAPLRQARAAEIEFAQSESPIERQTRATNFILDEVRKLSGRDIQTFEQLPHFLIQNPQHDAAVCEIVKASGYLDFWKEDVLRNSWRYDAVEFRMLPVPSGERERVARRELTAAEQQLQQFTFMYGQYMTLWQRAKLNYFATEMQIYMHLIDAAKQRIEAARQVLEQRPTGDA